ETGQTLLSGMGELHLEVAVEKVRRAQGLDVNVGRPRVTYRETVARGVVGHVYRHVKQDGGAGQFAHVRLGVGPLQAVGGPGAPRAAWSSVRPSSAGGCRRSTSVPWRRVATTPSPRARWAAMR